MAEHNGSRIPPWFLKIVITVLLAAAIGIGGGTLAWGTWVTKGIFKVEQMADDIRDIKQILLDKYPHPPRRKQ